MTPELTLKLASAVDRMPAFPRSVQRIQELTRDMNCAPKDLVRVIESDPVVTVKILKVVNSAYYNLSRQITSVNHAVVHLGINSIKNLALIIAAVGMLPGSTASGFDTQQYLLHSLATGGIARRLAQKRRVSDPMDCFIAGLLHDFGKVVFAQFMPEEFRAALARVQQDGSSLHEALREAVGADHAVVGAMLVQKWRFAPELVEAIRHQHGADVPDTDMVACLFAANQIAKKMAFGFAGNPFVEELPPAVAARVGGTLDEVIADLGDLNEVFEEAQVFARL